MEVQLQVVEQPSRICSVDDALEPCRAQVGNERVQPWQRGTNAPHAARAASSQAAAVCPRAAAAASGPAAAGRYAWASELPPQWAGPCSGRDIISFFAGGQAFIATGVESQIRGELPDSIGCRQPASRARRSERITRCAIDLNSTSGADAQQQHASG